MIDPDRMRQVMDNLLSNVVRAAPPGTVVEVRVEAVTTEVSTAGVTISVRDHGAGFAPEFLPHAFERFRRADAARTRTSLVVAGGGGGSGPRGRDGPGPRGRRAHRCGPRGRAWAQDCPDGGALVGITIPHHDEPQP